MTEDEKKRLARLLLEKIEDMEKHLNSSAEKYKLSRRKINDFIKTSGLESDLVEPDHCPIRVMFNLIVALYSQIQPLEDEVKFLKSQLDPSWDSFVIDFGEKKS